MNSKKSPKGWTLNQGLAAQYAAQAGIDSDLAAAAGDTAWDVLKSLRDAADESDSKKRSKRAAKTRRLLAKSGLRKHVQLQKAIAARLNELLGEPRPSVNPDTGLQEFYSLADQWPMSRALQKERDETLINPPMPGRKPLDTQAFYWQQKWQDEQPGVEFAQRAVDAFNSDLSNTHDAHARRNAQMSVFFRKWLPSNPEVDQVPSRPEQFSDFLKMQGVNPETAGEAPVIDTTQISKLYEDLTPIREVVPNLEVLNSDPIKDAHFYHPQDGSLRLRTRQTFNDDPMSPVYNHMRTIQDQSGTLHDKRKRAQGGAGGVGGLGFRS